jgi:hypothetical protein
LCALQERYHNLAATAQVGNFECLIPRIGYTSNMTQHGDSHNARSYILFIQQALVKLQSGAESHGLNQTGSIKLVEKPQDAEASQNNHVKIAKKASLCAMSRGDLSMVLTHARLDDYSDELGDYGFF